MTAAKMVRVTGTYNGGSRRLNDSVQRDAPNPQRRGRRLGHYRPKSRRRLGRHSPNPKRTRNRVVGARGDAPHVYTRMEAEASLRQSGQRKGTRGAVTGAAPSAVPGGGGAAAEQLGAMLGGMVWHGSGAVLGGMAVAEHSAHKHR